MLVSPLIPCLPAPLHPAVRAVPRSQSIDLLRFAQTHLSLGLMGLRGLLSALGLMHLFPALGADGQCPHHTAAAFASPFTQRWGVAIPAAMITMIHTSLPSALIGGSADIRQPSPSCSSRKPPACYLTAGRSVTG